MGAPRWNWILANSNKCGMRRRRRPTPPPAVVRRSAWTHQSPAARARGGRPSAVGLGGGSRDHLMPGRRVRGDDHNPLTVARRPRLSLRVESRLRLGSSTESLRVSCHFKLARDSDVSSITKRS
eukprot:3143769-Rhodomonas_salina.1